MKKFTTFETQLGESVVLTDKAKLSLYKKSSNSGIAVDILEEVYRRGFAIWGEQFGGAPDSFAFDRVNSFIAGGFAAQLDEDLLDEKRGLWDNIHAKRKRIKAGSGERMRKPGSKGAPTDAAIRASQNEDTDPCWKGYKQIGMKTKGGRKVPNCVPVKEQSTPSVEQIAKKHDVTVASVEKAVAAGRKVEKEHTKSTKQAEKIARDHLGERPDYYKKLKQMEKTPMDEEKLNRIAELKASLFEFVENYKEVDEAAMYMPPQIEQPRIERPAPARQFSRSVTTSARMGSGAGAQSARVQVQRAAPARAISSRMSGQGGATTAQVQVQRAAPMRGPTSTMPAGQSGSMSGKPTVGGNSLNKTEFLGKNMGSKMGDGLDSVSRNMSKGFAGSAEKAAGSVAGRVAGGALRTALGPAGMAAAAVMEPTPAGEKMSEFKRQETLKSYNPFKSQGRSIDDYEKQQVTRKSASAPTADEAPKPKVTADVPTPPSRPDYMTRGQAFQAARSEAGGGSGEFSYGGKDYQTNVAGEKYKPETKLKKTSVSEERLNRIAELKASLYEFLEEGDVIRTKFAVKNMQKRGIEGPHKIAADDFERAWAINKMPKKSEDDRYIAYHGDTARIMSDPSKGKHADIKRGAEHQLIIDPDGSKTGKRGIYATDPIKTSIVRKQAPKKTGNVVPLKTVKEATYQGKTVPLNKPMKGDVKKSKVYVDPDGDGKAQKVNFGDKSMSIKKDQPGRKKSYCARSGGIKGTSDKTSANYWSRKAWNCSEETVDESWSSGPKYRPFTMGKNYVPPTDEQRAKIKDVIKNMKVPGPKDESPEDREARMARNAARQRAAVGMKEDAEVHSKDSKKPSSRFDGSKELVANYKKDTPGQDTK